MLNPEENRKIWLRALEESRDLMENEVLPSIERNRKGYCKLHFVDENGAPIVGKKVKITQESHDFKFGAHIFMLDGFGNEKDNRKYRDLFADYFNLATVPFYWDGLEPEEGKPRFGKDSPFLYRRPATELCVEYCEDAGIDAKLHCLVYDKFTPDWLPKNDMAAMEKRYEQHIREIADRYHGRLSEFEVINETLCEHGWSNQSVIMNKRDVVEWAFDLARKYLPDETLVINECNYIVPTAKQDYRSAYFMQLEKCLLRGTSIDKIGLQHHIFTGASTETAEEYEAAVRKGSEMVDPRLLWKGLNVYAELGLPLEITEMTVPTFGETEEDEQLQADLLKLLYTIFFAHPAMNSVVYWNTVDGYAYDISCDLSKGRKRGWHENKCHGGLFRHDLTPKKSSEMLYNLFHKEWHTEFEAVTDENGYVEFRGFYGEYSAETEDTACVFELHKDESPVTEIEL